METTVPVSTTSINKSSRGKIIHPKGKERRDRHRKETNNMRRKKTKTREESLKRRRDYDNDYRRRRKWEEAVKVREERIRTSEEKQRAADQEVKEKRKNKIRKFPIVEARCCFSNFSRRILATRQSWDSNLGGFKPPDIVASVFSWEDSKDPIEICLNRGGKVTIYPNILSKKNSDLIQSEIMLSGWFRQYRIQGVNEPRAHFLLHPDATDDFNDKQPGYRYSNVTLKGRPLSDLPCLAHLSESMAALCSVEKWNIGVNPVLYRDGKDKMGDHADNDQGERAILAILVASPEQGQRVCIRPFSYLEKKNRDEYMEIYMESGDAYLMDGDMQQNYAHSIPPVEEVDQQHRLAVIFRSGTQKKFQKDSGSPLVDFLSRVPKTYSFGKIVGLEEGKIYKRNKLLAMGAHLAAQRCISGNMKVGCDALIVCGLRLDKARSDRFLSFTFQAEKRVGAGSLVRSFHMKTNIRVFRSSVLKNPYRAVSMTVETGSSSSAFYRYDGLYAVTGFEGPGNDKSMPYNFFLERCGDKINNISNENIVDYCFELGNLNRL